jgi:ferredoxin
MKIDLDRCTGCGICVQDCPLGAIKIRERKVSLDDRCIYCGACERICPQEALSLEGAIVVDRIQCDACPVGCRIKEGYRGACHRYGNDLGKLVRITPLHTFEDVEEVVGPDFKEVIRRPLMTGIGTGTTYPDCKPSPYIVKGQRGDVDVVTVVTEAPLSYSSITVKIDTDIPIGEEGADVLVGRRKVGMVITEQYGSKMLSIGGVNLLTGPDGLLVARTICDIANKKPARLRIGGGSRLHLQVGKPPVVDGKRPSKMRVGCGSATLGLFAPLLQKAADDAIVLDSHLTGLMSEHVAGRFAEARSAGIRLRFKQSTPGRYFGDHGKGWGGTSIVSPLDVIAEIDRRGAWVGMRILITETTGQRAAMFELGEDGDLEEIPLTEEARYALQAITASCEPSLVSALYIGGAGGSARAGAVRYPVKLTSAVHQGKANLTVGGAPTFILPGGGITFEVDVQRVKTGSFYWTPTPATICPMEYTMELQDYEEMGGHLQAMKPFDAVMPLSRYD